MKKFLFASALALVSISASAAIEPIGEHTHQVVIVVDDGQPPVTLTDGTISSTLTYRQGPYTKEQCDDILPLVVGWFLEAGEDINGKKRAGDPLARIVSSACRRI